MCIFTAEFQKLVLQCNQIQTGVDDMTEQAYVHIIRDLREDAHKTQTQIADVLGTSQTMYARYERGANEMPIHHLMSLSKYYGVSSDYILGLPTAEKARH
jgi:transcriptional regulator with XRE-family HTH domain